MNRETTSITSTLRWASRALLLLVIVLVAWWLLFSEKDNHVGLQVDDGINLTPEQIQSVKDIGEWEFLSVRDEELVDTVRKGFLSTDQLVRIYYGTLRLGINMHDVEPGWIEASGDTVTLTLPAVRLLDRDFIDEARTKAFYESGKWTGHDREALYRKAHRMMLAHCLTPANLRTAESNADAQFRRMMKGMGFNHVNIRFKPQK